MFWQGSWDLCVRFRNVIGEAYFDAEIWEAYFPAKQMYYRVMDNWDSKDYNERSRSSPVYLLHWQPTLLKFHNINCLSVDWLSWLGDYQFITSQNIDCFMYSVCGIIMYLESDQTGMILPGWFCKSEGETSVRNFSNEIVSNSRLIERFSWILDQGCTTLKRDKGRAWEIG